MKTVSRKMAKFKDNCQSFSLLLVLVIYVMFKFQQAYRAKKYISAFLLFRKKASTTTANASVFTNNFFEFLTYWNYQLRWGAFKVQ